MRARGGDDEIADGEILDGDVAGGSADERAAREARDRIQSGAAVGGVVRERDALPCSEHRIGQHKAE